MKKVFAIILSAVLVLSLACCGKTNVVETPSETSVQQEATAANVTNQIIEAAENTAEEIHIGVQNNIESLSPFTISGMAGGFIVDTIYETLGGYYGFGGEFKGMAMKNWVLDEDGYTWHIELYDNIYDTAGNHITSSDIKFFYEEGKAQANANMSYIDAVNIIDDYNLDFVMNVNQAGRFERICTAFYVFSQAAYEASEDQMVTTPVGTTPYVLTDFVSGSSLTFEATDHYWQNSQDTVFGLSNVKKIVFHIIPEAAQLSIALETGVIDIAENLNGTEAERLASEGFSTVMTDAHLCYVLLYNCDADEGMFADNLKLRQSIAYAINRSDIIEAVASGYGTELKNYGSSNYGDYTPANADGDYYAYNAEMAKQLAAEAGYDGRTIRLVCGSAETSKNAATVIQAYLIAAGFNCEIDAQDNNIFNVTKGDPTAFDLLLDTKGDQAYMIGLLRNSFDVSNFASGKPANFVLDDTLQSLIDTASSEEGHTLENVQAAADYVAQNCYGIGLFVLKNFYAHNDQVEKLIFSQWDTVVPGCCTYSGN